MLDIEPTCQIPRKVLETWYTNTFKAKTEGQLVEVGAFDGITYSNTSCLIKLGWHALLIEPYPQFAECCRVNWSNYPKVKIEECCVAANEEDRDLFLGGAVSSILWTEATKAWGLVADNKIKVKAKRLDTVLTQYQITPGFDLLVIDVEESELLVLEGFNVKFWYPVMVIIETHEKDTNPIRNWKAVPITSYFEAAGYEKVYTDHINSIFRRKE